MAAAQFERSVLACRSIIARHIDAMLADLKEHTRELCACSTSACIEAANRRYVDLIRRRSYPPLREADLDPKHKRLVDDTTRRTKTCTDTILCRAAVDEAVARGESRDAAIRERGCTTVLP